MSSPIAPFTGWGDDTNSSIKFGILAPGGDVPLWDVEARVNTFDVPMSNRVITQYSGMGLWTVTFEVSIDSVTYLEQLQNLQGQRATLRYQYRVTNNPGGDVTDLQGVSYVVLPDTLLARVGGMMRRPDGSCQATLSFTRAAETSSYYGFSLYSEDEE